MLIQLHNFFHLKKIHSWKWKIDSIYSIISLLKLTHMFLLTQVTFTCIYLHTLSLSKKLAEIRKFYFTVNPKHTSIFRFHIKNKYFLFTEWSIHSHLFFRRRIVEEEASEKSCTHRKIYNIVCVINFFSCIEQYLRLTVKCTREVCHKKG